MCIEHLLSKSAGILNGVRIAGSIVEKTRDRLHDYLRHGKRRPRLILITVGLNKVAKAAVERKKEVANMVGLESDIVNFEKNVTERVVLSAIRMMNMNPRIDAISIQRPTPKHINPNHLMYAVAPQKDCDGQHVNNIGKMALNLPTIHHVNAMSVYEILTRYSIPTHGQRVVVCGRSWTTGLPIAMLMQGDKRLMQYGMDATVSVCNESTPKETLVSLTQTADIVITAAGVPKLLTKEMVKPGACIIDIGLSYCTTQNMLVGDVDFEGVSQVAGYITPVPSVGPVIIAIMMRNIVQAAERTPAE